MTNKITLIFLMTALVVSSGCDLAGPKTNSNSSSSQNTSTTDTNVQSGGTGRSGGSGGGSGGVTPTASSVYALAKSYAAGTATDMDLRAAFDALEHSSAGDLNPLAAQGDDFALLVAKGAASTGADAMIPGFFAAIQPAKAIAQVKAIVDYNATNTAPFVRLTKISGVSDTMARLYLQTITAHVINGFEVIFQPLEAATNQEVTDAFTTFLGGMLGQLAGDPRDMSHWFYEKGLDSTSKAFKHGYQKRNATDKATMRDALLGFAYSGRKGTQEDINGVLDVIQRGLFTPDELKAQYNIDETNEPGSLANIKAKGIKQDEHAKAIFDAIINKLTTA